jgi:hypothetical protein
MSAGVGGVVNYRAGPGKSRRVPMLGRLDVAVPDLSILKFFFGV